MYKKILVPLDGSNFSEQVLPYAQMIAEAYHSHADLISKLTSCALTRCRFR